VAVHSLPPDDFLKVLDMILLEVGDKFDILYQGDTALPEVD